MADNQTLAAIFAAATALQQHTLLSYLPIEDEFEDLDVPTEEETEEYDKQTEMDASQIMYLGSLVSIVTAALPPPGSTSRGPYNQYQKCTQFFTVSMEWPDQEFRHEYRSVLFSPWQFPVLNACTRMSRETFDRLVGLLEKDPIFLSGSNRPQCAV